LKIYIPQGSVATQLRYGGIFSNHFITKFPENVRWKILWKSVNILAMIWTTVCGLLSGSTL